MSSTAALETASAAFVHEAFPYHDNGGFLAGVLPYVRTALAEDRPVLVELPAPRGDLVRDALGDDAAQVTFGDMAQHGRNPGRIIPGVLAAFVDAHAGHPATLIGEPIWPGRSTHEYARASSTRRWSTWPSRASRSASSARTTRPNCPCRP